MSYYTNGTNQFGNSDVILVINSASGPNWLINIGGGGAADLITKEHVYHCVAS
jgi:hypothetical protein